MWDENQGAAIQELVPWGREEDAFSQVSLHAWPLMWSSHAQCDDLDKTLGLELGVLRSVPRSVINKPMIVNKAFQLTDFFFNKVRIQSKVSFSTFQF